MFVRAVIFRLVSSALFHLHDGLDDEVRSFEPVVALAERLSLGG
jgi:hypothetical protein